MIIKTYEGFFDFLKKKKKSTEPIYFDDIKECLLDLTEDLRVTNTLTGRVNGIFADVELVDTSNVEIVRMQYDRDEITNDEVKRLLEICSSKLKTYDFVTSFYIGWGRSEGRSEDKEYKSIDKLFSTINKVDRNPNITIKITASSEIIR
jgi:hypothetical protein